MKYSKPFASKEEIFVAIVNELAEINTSLRMIRQELVRK